MVVVVVHLRPKVLVHFKVIQSKLRTLFSVKRALCCDTIKLGHKCNLYICSSTRYLASYNIFTYSEYRAVIRTYFYLHLQSFVQKFSSLLLMIESIVDYTLVNWIQIENLIGFYFGTNGKNYFDWLPDSKFSFHVDR